MELDEIIGIVSSQRVTFSGIRGLKEYICQFFDTNYNLNWCIGNVLERPDDCRLINLPPLDNNSPLTIHTYLAGIDELLSHPHTDKLFQAKVMFTALDDGQSFDQKPLVVQTRNLTTLENYMLSIYFSQKEDKIGYVAISTLYSTFMTDKLKHFIGPNINYDQFYF